MKSINLKLVVSILVIFGLLILGYVLYEPVWWRVQEARLCSDDAATRQTAAKAVAAKGGSAIPHIKEWLKSENDRGVVGACMVLEVMEAGTSLESLPELQHLLANSIEPCIKTDAAAWVILKKDRNWNAECKNNPNLYLMLYAAMSEADESRLSYPQSKTTAMEMDVVLFGYMPYHDLANNRESCIAIRCMAAARLGELGDRRATSRLISVLQKDISECVRAYAAWALGNLNDSRIISTLISIIRKGNKKHVQAHSAIALDRLLPDFPGNVDTGRSSSTLEQVDKLEAWLKKHKHRLAWDADSRCYYLKAE